MRKITKKSKYMQPVILIKNDHSEILTNGSLMMIKGEAGSGKSRLAMNLIVGFSGKSDNLGFQYSVCPPDKNVIYLSTEMSPYAIQKRLLKILEVCPPEYENQLHFFDQSGDSPEQKLKDLKDLCKEFPPHVIIIDQIGDYVVDINDNKECSALVNSLQEITSSFDCAMICIMHQNEDSGPTTKARGHLGSIMEQKIVSALSIQDKYSNFYIQSTKLRDGKQIKITAVFDEVTTMLKIKEDKEIVSKLTFPCTANELVNQIAKLTGKGTTSCRMIKLDLEKEGKIISNKEGKEVVFNLPKNL